MQLFCRQLPSKCRIVMFSDTHIGSLATHYEAIEKCVEDIAKPNTWAVGLGDYCEAQTIDHPHFVLENADMSVPTPMRQYLKAADMLKPIAKKILYLNEGNHDARFARTVNLMRDVLCRELDVPFGTYTSKLSIADDKGRTRIKILTTHGFGSMGSSADDPIRVKSNLLLSLKRKLKNLAGDCHAQGCGHTHQLHVASPLHTLYLSDDGESIKKHYLDTTVTDGPYIAPDHRWYFNTGSFYKTQGLGYSTYAERFGLAPQPIGYCVVHIDGWRIQNIEEVML